MPNNPLTISVTPSPVIKGGFVVTAHSPLGGDVELGRFFSIGHLYRSYPSITDVLEELKTQGPIPNLVWAGDKPSQDNHGLCFVDGPFDALKVTGFDPIRPRLPSFLDVGKAAELIAFQEATDLTRALCERDGELLADTIKLMYLMGQESLLAQPREKMVAYAKQQNYQVNGPAPLRGAARILDLHYDGLLHF